VICYVVVSFMSIDKNPAPGCILVIFIPTAVIDGSFGLDGKDLRTLNTHSKVDACRSPRVSPS
jgi:hypothetical protein